MTPKKSTPICLIDSIVLETKSSVIFQRYNGGREEEEEEEEEEEQQQQQQQQQQEHEEKHMFLTENIK